MTGREHAHRTPTREKQVKLIFDPEDQVPVIKRLATLPYHATYAEWIGHVNECAQCAYTTSAGSNDTRDLCEEGEALQHAITYDLQVQSTVAALN